MESGEVSISEDMPETGGGTSLTLLMILSKT